MQAMTQMNVRVNVERKRQAEAVLELTGGSLGALVRKLLDKVASGAQGAEEVRAVLEGERETAVQTADSKTHALFAKIDRHYDELASALGTRASSFVPLSDEQLEEALYDGRLEREQERVAWYD